MTCNNEKTTMSVAEMRHLLGLGKTDAYWLVHKNRFETILVNGKMRIVKDSFEKWYANQVKYKKIDGSPPGEELRASSYSVRELSELLATDENNIYTLLKSKELPSIKVDYWMRIPKDAFEKWYASQNRFRTPVDRERDRETEENSMTMPEAARLLGISRSEMYRILKAKENRKVFRIVVIAGRKRIMKDSFETWYAGQKTYIKRSEAPPPPLPKPKPKKPRPVPKVQDIDPGKSAYSPSEAAVLLDLTVNDTYDLIRSGDLPADLFAGKYRISRYDISWWLDRKKTNKEKED